MFLKVKFLKTPVTEKYNFLNFLANMTKNL